MPKEIRAHNNHVHKNVNESIQFPRIPEISERVIKLNFDNERKSSSNVCVCVK